MGCSFIRQGGLLTYAKLDIENSEALCTDRAFKQLILKILFFFVEDIHLIQKLTYYF